MAKRKSLSKKTRFEVFKRDSFTCQYCGRKAPDVLLHIDHIKPVADGGDNDLLNLVTSCAECNLGKGARNLSDDAVISAKRNQLEELQERREQIEMMYEWQSGLVELSRDAVDCVSRLIMDITDYELSEGGRSFIKSLISKFGLDEVMEATRIAFDTYDFRTDYQWNKAFKKIGGICYNRAHKTCRQCIHYMGYDNESHLVECEYLIEDTDFHRNSYAEKCEAFEAFHSEVSNVG